MANNVLDMLGRAVLRIGGMSPQQIRQQVRANRTPKPMPTSRGSKPSSPKPPAPGSIKPKGQTNAFARNGSVRDFRNPKVAANRPPTLSPVPQRGGQATPPNRPAGGFGQSPGQKSLNLKQGSEITRSSSGAATSTRQPASRGGALATQGRDPLGGQRSLPPGRRGGPVEKAGPTIDVKAETVSTSRNGGGSRSVGSSGRGSLPAGTGKPNPASVAGGVGRPPAGGSRLAGLRGGIGTGLGAVGTGLTIASVLGAIRDAKDGYDQAIRQANLDKTLPQMTPAQNAKAVRLGLAQPSDVGNRNSGAAGRTQARQAPAPPNRTQVPAPAAPRAPRSPASAPVHAAPAQLRQAPPAQQALAPAPVQPSVYAPQVGQAPRPNTPQPAAQPQPMSPQYGGNDEPGRLGQSEGGYAGNSQQAPANENGFDMERRRAFLDADNSLDGMAAVRELLKRRKLSISVSD